MIEPTQITFPLRTMLRTLIQVLVGAAGAWAVRVLGVTFDPTSESVVTIIDCLSTISWIVLTTLTSWLMTRPTIVRLLNGTILAPSPEDYEPKRMEV